MRTLRTVAELNAALANQRRVGVRIGLVPTMGAFHDGHLSLMRRAREQCDVVVVSLFVNPSQFDESSDLDVYPRDEARDAAFAAELGVDYLFAPIVAEMYPDGFSTTVSVGGITETLEGAERGRGHFDGVTTVVAKLLNSVRPEVAYFGQKDAQQAQVVRRMVRDLNMPVEIEVCPIVRDPDGLALSSRNVRLSQNERARATALHRSLEAVDARVVGGERDVVNLKHAAQSELEQAGIAPEYFEVVDADSFTPITHVDRPALALVAARVGATRLIDNQSLSTTNGSATGGGSSNGQDHNGGKH